MKRIIALIDCDSFFVSCEQADDKGFKGLPVCVVSGRNGCVLSRSKEAKELGVRMGMPLFMAKKEFPESNYIIADHSKYKKYSRMVMDCLQDFSPDIEIVSVDEAYIDLTGTRKLFKKNYTEVAAQIRQTILEKTDIPVSIGISHSKILAKLASDKAKKTGGIYTIGLYRIKSVLDKTDIDEICGIGRANSLKLKREGILTALELVSKTDDWLKSRLGINGVELKHELLGETISKVNGEYEAPKSIQDTSTINDGSFTSDINVVKTELSRHIHNACSRLRKHKGKCKCVGLMLKTKDFITYYDKKILLKPTDFELTVKKSIDELLNKLYKNGVIYRACGIVLEQLTFGGEQLSLFDNGDKKEENLSKCIESIEKRFGKNSIRTGF